MKRYAKLLAVSAAILTLLTGCSNGSTSSAESSAVEVKSPKAADITAKITEAIEFPGMAEVTADRLSNYYDIAAEDIEEFSLYICGSGAYPDEVAVFKMNSDDKANDVKALMDTRKEKLTATFTDYTPEEMYKLEDAIIEVKGSYAIFVACKDNSTASSLIDECF